MHQIAFILRYYVRCFLCGLAVGARFSDFALWFPLPQSITMDNGQLTTDNEFKKTIGD
jgi:hypothetical protein